MKTFLRLAFKFSLPGLIYIAIVSLLYFIFDPFKVLYTYPNYYENTQNGYVAINKGHVSTKTFIQNSRTTAYNSFILGNSRSMFFQINDWKKHLPKSAIGFHFDASSESLWDLNNKVNFMNKMNVKFENILLVLDHDLLPQDKPKNNHLFITSPPLIGNSNIFEFQSSFYKAFFSPKFLFAFLDFKTSGKVKPYMYESSLISNNAFDYDVATNEVRFQNYENLINNNNYYTPDRLAVFYKRDTTLQKIAPQYIYEKQKAIFNNIYSIAKKNHAQVKIIISPLYDQLKISDYDLNYLKNLFGAQNVVDFSGINHFTNNYKNYYEQSHYRPHIAKQLMDSVYSQNHKQ